MIYKFDPQKNSKLIEQRKISFDEIVDALLKGQLLQIKKHPNITKYPRQKILYVKVRNEIYLVPCVEGDNEIFLKTIFPSRKARKEIMRKTNYEKLF